MTRKSTALALVPPPSAITILSPSSIHEAKQFLPVESFERLPFWDKLDKGEQKVLINNSSGLSASLIANTVSDFSIGYYLTLIQAQLLPYRGAFTNFLKTQYNAKVARTAYRQIGKFRRIENYLPEAIWKAAAARGIRFFSASDKRPLGDWTEGVEMMLANGDTPPNTEDPAKVNRWWEKAAICKQELDASPRKKATITRRLEKKNADLFIRANSDSSTKQRDAYRMIRSAMKDMTGAEKVSWLDDLVGMAMTEAGIASRKSFSPQAIPEEFKQGRGRPRLVQAEAESEDLAVSA